MRFAFLALLLGAVACDCGGDPGSDLAPSDAAVTGDAGTRDAASGDLADAAVDLGEPDLGPADGGVDAGVDLDLGPPAPMCSFLDDVFIVSCAAGYRYLRRWYAIDGGECPDYYTLDGATFETEAEALASDACSPDCTRHPSTSLTIIRCGVRTGYIIFRDDDCDVAIETPDGIFPSREAWDEAHPCE